MHKILRSSIALSDAKRNKPHNMKLQQTPAILMAINPATRTQFLRYSTATNPAKMQLQQILRYPIAAKPRSWLRGGGIWAWGCPNILIPPRGDEP